MCLTYSHFVYENYKSLDEYSFSGIIEDFRPATGQAALALEPAVKLYKFVHDILSPEAQTAFCFPLQSYYFSFLVILILSLMMGIILNFTMFPPCIFYYEDNINTYHLISSCILLRFYLIFFVITFLNFYQRKI